MLSARIALVVALNAASTVVLAASGPLLAPAPGPASLPGPTSALMATSVAPSRPAAAAALSGSTQLPAEFDLPAALVIFHSRGFDLLLAETDVAAAQSDVQAAGAVANPLLAGSVGHTGGRYHPSQCGSPGCSATAYTVNLSDQAALGDVASGKRSLRVAVAAAALTAARKGLDDARRNLDVVLKSQYLAGAIDVANLRFLINVQQSFANTYELFSARYAAGDISETDLVRMETAALEAEQNVDAAQEQVRVDKVGLAYLLGVRGATPDFEVEAAWLEKISDNTLIEVPESHWIAIARERRPDLQAQRAQQQRAAAGLRLSHRKRVPDLQLTVGYQQEGDAENAIQPPTFTGGIALSLPAFYQYQGEVARSRVDAAAQDIAYAKLEAQIVADVGRAYASMTAGHRRLHRMQNKLRAQAARALELVQLQYEKGAASLLDLLDAQRTFIAINQEYIGDLNAFWLALVQLEGAVAMELKP